MRKKFSSRGLVLSLAKRDEGFTLTELLIVIAIIIIILIVLLISLRGQIDKANDAKRKADLNRIQKAFEEYFNDRSCYPADTILSNCGGAQLQPYVKAVPCDPVKRQPYLYVVGTPSLCSGYRVCAKLQNLGDPDITRIGCHPVNGCGFGAGYNYCVAVGVPVNPEGFNPEIPVPTEGPTPTPTPIPGKYGCQQTNCNDYGTIQHAQDNCNVTYQGPCIHMGVFQCNNPVNWCHDRNL